MYLNMVGKLRENKNFLYFTKHSILYELLKIFSNYTRSLEILYLLNNIKDAVRLDSNEIELRKIKEFCEKENLFLEISDFKVIKIQDKGKGGYANIAKKVPISYLNHGLYHIYLSKDKNKKDPKEAESSALVKKSKGREKK